MKYTVESDIGRKRKVNEDRVAFFEHPHHFKLAILADGMGGHNAGDVASEMAIEEMKSHFLQVDQAQLETPDAKKTWLDDVISTINNKIYQHSLSHEGCNGMGTTLIAVLIDEQDCVVAHIGDSRVYYFTSEHVALITRDHSYVNVLLDHGEISEEEAENHPQKNFIVKSLGTESTIDPDFYNFTLEQSSYLLICSDGLSNKITTDEMAAILALPMSINEKGKKLIQLANDSGGEDNISVILLSLNDGEV
ncbi:Stp1/IreP family PP2C-type Ser/Thr phosphatase [Lysinibacillus sp. BW-2-10]|uniref:Stp1/IreP family PP2C-type Ser/Thr phosphatase n=1 Tax=Lysinibacillus sp. BW-2-10 TaxID=2590030 RepID=UPI00117BE6C0|nr:Stp1/IreP family PP2C-type Ser/Thr phosphatase [Lysinibacillus sp. BW-2-10]TSI11455.1 Stp1/IreP family PP2C-type Ser/Thr phosphatase [Lysinibacillus sp. BW-2-10]